MFRHCLFFLFLALVLGSCSNKYEPYLSHYRFKSQNGTPDYSDLNYWAAHPWKWDPGDSVPAPLRGEAVDTSVDVFFLHPTTFTKKKKRKQGNAPIDDPFINARTDYSTILYQASVFNQEARIFAPRYRQAHISNFFIADSTAANHAFEKAYEDLRMAFEYYLAHWNNQRPIIIAGHSQGSMLAERLLKDFFEDRPLQKQLVAVYIPGWEVPPGLFHSLKMCEDPSETACLCSWRTLRRGYVPSRIPRETGISLATNPLNWTTGDDYAGRNLNKGSVLRDFNRIFPHTTDARLSNGLLYVKKPKFPGSFLYFRRNYHIGDINLFYLNLRENIRNRVRAYRAKQAATK